MKTPGHKAIRRLLDAAEEEFAGAVLSDRAETAEWRLVKSLRVRLQNDALTRVDAETLFQVAALVYVDRPGRLATALLDLKEATSAST